MLLRQRLRGSGCLTRGRCISGKRARIPGRGALEARGSQLIVGIVNSSRYLDHIQIHTLTIFTQAGIYNHFVQIQMLPRSPSHSSSSNQQTLQSVTINRTSSLQSAPRPGLNYKDMTQSQFLSDSMMFNSQIIPNSPSGSVGKQSYYAGNTAGYGAHPNKAHEVAQLFMHYYGNGQGVIPKQRVSELLGAAYHRSIEGPPPNTENVEELFAIYDQNGDKRITIEDISSLAARYLGIEPKKVVYTRVVQQKLDVARRLFKMFDVEKRGYLTDKEVPNLLNKTYQTLGKSYIASKEDIQSWMHITDDDKDGKVRLQEYEASIIRSMKKMGVKIYDDPISHKM